MSMLTDEHTIIQPSYYSSVRSINADEGLVQFNPLERTSTVYVSGWY